MTAPRLNVDARLLGIGRTSPGAPRLRRERALRVLPFALAALGGFATIPFPPHPPGHGHELVAAAFVLTVLVVASSFALPWWRLPPWVELVQPMGFLGVTALLRHGEGGASSGFSLFLLLPLFWVALYGHGRDLALVVAGSAVTLGAPVLLIGAPLYPPGEWRRLVLWLVLGSLVGVAVQRLVRRIQAFAVETERLRAQQQVILSSVGEAIIWLDPTGRITYANEAASELTGWPLDDFAGAELHERAYHSRPGDSPHSMAECPIVAAVRSGRPYAGGVEVLWRRGTPVPVEYAVRPSRDGDPRQGAVVVIRDATARQRAERFARTHLAVARVLADSSTYEQAATRIVEALATALECQAVALWDTEPGREVLTLRELWSAPGSTADLHQVVTQSLEAARPKADQREIGLDAVLEDVPLLHGDAERLGQAVDNLVSNALKFTRPRGHIAVSLREEDGDAVVTVTDTGRGIARADRQRLFDRFVRADAAVRDAIPGVGLGLSIVKAIVEGHGGRGLTSEVGVGSSFEIRLPLEPAAGGAAGQLHDPRRRRASASTRSRARH